MAEFYANITSMNPTGFGVRVNMEGRVNHESMYYAANFEAVGGYIVSEMERLSLEEPRNDRIAPVFRNEMGQNEVAVIRTFNGATPRTVGYNAVPTPQPAAPYNNEPEDENF